MAGSGTQTGDAPGRQTTPVGSHFTGVSLLAVVDGSTVAVPDLALSLEREGGFTLTRAGGSLVWSAGWDELAEVEVTEQATDGERAAGVVLEVTTTEGRTHRFLLPIEEPLSLKSALAVLTAHTDTARPSGERSQPLWLVVATVAVTAVVVTLLLLAAGHVVHL